MADVDGLPDEDFDAVNAEAPDDNDSLGDSDGPSYVSDEEYLNEDVSHELLLPCVSALTVVWPVQQRWLQPMPSRARLSGVFRALSVWCRAQPDPCEIVRQRSKTIAVSTAE